MHLSYPESAMRVAVAMDSTVKIYGHEKGGFREFISATTWPTRADAIWQAQIFNENQRKHLALKAG